MVEIASIRKVRLTFDTKLMRSICTERDIALTKNSHKQVKFPSLSLSNFLGIQLLVVALGRFFFFFFSRLTPTRPAAIRTGYISRLFIKLTSILWISPLIYDDLHHSAVKNGWGSLDTLNITHCQFINKSE